MRAHGISPILVAILIAGLTGIASAQEDPPIPRPNSPARMTSPGSISGRVVLPLGHPVNQSVKIRLNTAEMPGMLVSTDNSGMFRFSGLREGVYYIEVISDDKQYETVTEQVRLLHGMHVTLHIPLREKEASAKKSPGVVSVAELDPRIPAAAKREFERATLLAGEGKLEQAVERFRKAIEIYPRYLIARNDLGVQYLKLKRPAEATEQFEAAIEINPKAFNPRLNLGIALIKRKMYLEAIDQLNEALSIDSSQPAAHLYLGVASVETDELDRAERELSTAFSLGGPAYSVVHFYLAQVHLKKGDRDQAIRELRTYLEKAPDSEEAERARLLLEQLNQV